LFRCVLDLKASLGECPMWSIAEQALYFVDINAPSLNRYDPEAGTHRAMPMPVVDRQLRLAGGGGFVVALRDGVWLADAQGKLERKVADAPYDPAQPSLQRRPRRPPGTLLGRLDEREARCELAALYRLDPGGELDPVLDDIMISNGLAWSPDGRTMYHADTPTRTVRAFAYDGATGTPSSPRVHARWDGETDRPDGGAVDSAGHYWTAFYRGGRVVELDGGGRTVRELPVPRCARRCARSAARPAHAVRHERAPAARPTTSSRAAAVGRRVRDARRRARASRAALRRMTRA
jgi:sugar lactone lactonase YvrE